MTEEEIRPIAENYVEEYCHCSDGEYTDGSLVCAGIGTALIVSRQLEKRIAELKEQCSILADCNTCTSTCKTENIEMKEQLTKAKDILRYVLNSFVGDLPEELGFFDEEELKAIAEAEQFLKESEQ